MWNFKSSQFSKCVVLDLINLCLTVTNEVFRFMPDILGIFELQIVPTIEPLLHSKQTNSVIGMRQMKCAILIINNLGVGLNLLRPILADAENFTSRAKDGSYHISLNWRCLIAFECLQIVVSNPSMTDLFASSSLSIGAPVLIQILECYLKASRGIEQSQEKSPADQHPGSGKLSARGQGLYQSTQKIAKVINTQNLEGEIPNPTCP